jgi:membrane protease YdiL (CAAX protease family)
LTRTNQEHRLSADGESPNTSDASKLYGLGLIIFYLFVHHIWREHVFGQFSFVWLRAIFLVAVLLTLPLLERKGAGNDGTNVRAIWREHLGTLLFDLKQWRYAAFALLAILLGVTLVEILIPLNDRAAFSWMNLVELCIVPALSEEPVFRGLFTTALAKSFPAPLAIGLSALIFLSVHNIQVPTQIISIGLLGTILGTVFVKTRSIGLCMLLHIVWNAIVVFH